MWRMIRFCVGFAFDENKSHVLLIRKNRPAWQAGKFNGIGGHIEKGEEPAEGMVREFSQEAGFNTTVDQWRPMFVTHGASFGPMNEVHFFIRKLISSDAAP